MRPRQLGTPHKRATSFGESGGKRSAAATPRARRWRWKDSARSRPGPRARRTDTLARREKNGELAACRTDTLADVIAASRVVCSIGRRPKIRPEIQGQGSSDIRPKVGVRTRAHFPDADVGEEANVLANSLRSSPGRNRSGSLQSMFSPKSDSHCFAQIPVL